MLDRFEERNFETGSAGETRELGVSLGRKALPGEVYALEGDLGAGKTVLSQGFAKGLDIHEIVNSPTFTILQVYESGRIPLYHFDVYRIEDPGEMDEIGFDEYLYGDGVCLIEWAGNIEEILPENLIRIRISHLPDKGPDSRRITITGKEL